METTAQRDAMRKKLNGMPTLSLHTLPDRDAHHQRSGLHAYQQSVGAASGL